MPQKPLFICSRSTHESPVERLEGRKGPKNRPLMLLAADHDIVLEWENLPSGMTDPLLVLTIGSEFTFNGSDRIYVRTGDSDTRLAELEVLFADPYQQLTFALPIQVGEGGALRLRLEVEGQSDLWLFAPDQEASDGLEVHLPLIVDRAGETPDIVSSLSSLGSLQTFSWKEGCVLDALKAISDAGLSEQAGVAIRQHLDYFGFSSGDLVYENPRNVRMVNQLGSIETTLPFARVAEIDPKHPWVNLTLDFWKTLIGTDGSVQEDEMISCEGAYTVAYPMVLIAKERDEPEWYDVAETLLINTYRRLVRDDGVYLRHYPDGRRTFRNWARGLCWLLLGHVQTLRVLPTEPAKLLEQLEALAQFAAESQRSDGLWACFVDDEKSLPDTSASVGIAAAFAIGVREGLLPEEYRDRAVACRNSASEYINPLGFLSGCSQSNKGGEELQRSNYRVTLPYASGLYGLLEVSLLT